MVVRDDAAQGLYKKRRFGWTPTSLAENENERSFLRVIQEA